MKSHIKKAFERYPRRLFVPISVRSAVEFDRAFPIGYGQTVSQPTTVALMLQWLDPQNGDHIMDVGSGSGWTTALLSFLVGSKGVVHAVEIIPELLEFGRENCRRLGIGNAMFHLATKTYGWPSGAPYDRILVSATAEDLPLELVDQLKTGGKLVIPIGHDIWEIIKVDEDGFIEKRVHSGFVFVPLVKKDK